MPIIYLSLGSNQGDRERLLKQAIKLISERVGAVKAVSSFLQTKPIGFQSAYPFLNGALRVQTQLPPEALLEVLEGIEQDLGRQRKSINLEHFDRPIDIDILLYGDLRYTSYRLTIPHPRMYGRDFVLIPLREVWKGY